MCIRDSSQFADVNIPDNNAIRFGNSQDLQLYHDGANSSIQNSTGDLFIYGGSDDIRIRAKNDEESIVANPNGGVYVYHDGSVKLATVVDGIDISGVASTTFGLNIIDPSSSTHGAHFSFDDTNSKVLIGGVTSGTKNTAISIPRDTTQVDFGTHITLPDNGRIKLGQASDLQLYHDGSNSFISETGTGILYIQGSGTIRLRGTTTEENLIEAVENGAVSLYHNNSVKIATTSTGVDVTGNATLSGQLTLGSGNNLVNAGNLTLDVGGDITLDADGGDIKLSNGGTQFANFGDATGAVHIDAVISDDDIKFRGNDGGSTITALTLDMSEGGAATFNDSVTLSDELSINGTGTAQIKINGATGNESILRFYDGGSESWMIRQTNSDNVLSFRRNSNNYLSLSASGAVSTVGDVTVGGNLTVQGTTTTLNTATLDVEDKNITLNKGSGDTSGSANGAGITIQDAVDASTDATILWDASNDEFDFSHGVSVTGDLAVDTNVLKVDSSNNRIGVNKTSPAVSIDAGANTDAIHVPAGTTAQRPTGAAGQFRYNTTTGNFEGYTSEWGAIAGSGGGGSSSFAKDTFTGDGSTTAFTMSTNMSTENGLIVFIDGVYQADNVYSVSGTTLTFATAPLNSRIIEVFQFKVSSIVGVAPVLATMTGDGSDTTLALGTTPDSENQTFVTIDGVVQHKDTYSISGSTLTFSTAPPNTSKVEAIIFNNVNVAKETFQDADGDTKIQVEESTDEDKIRFDTGGTERVIIDSTGVGIGTSSMDSNLHIVDGTTQVNIEATTGDATLKLECTGENYWNIFNDTSDSNKLKFEDNGNGVLTTIDRNGNVGIGETSPAEELTVVGTIRVQSASGDSDGLHISSDSNGDALINAGYSVSDLKFATNDTERMRIDSSGNLLVGTTSSQGLITATTTGSTTFDCARTETSTANNIILRNGNGAVGSIQTSGSSTSYNTSSDQRLKENITDSDEARSKVNAIQVRKFNWKVDGSYQPYGMIAQELQSIVPEAVSSPEKPEEMFGVDYSKLVPLLTKAIQEQQKLIEDLKSRIEVLETPEAE